MPQRPMDSPADSRARSTSPAYGVLTASARIAACSKGSQSGISVRANDGTATYSAHPPS